MEDEFPAGGRGVDLLGEGFEADTFGVEGGDRLDEVPEGAAETVEAPDDEDVAFSELREGLVKSAALGCRAGDGVGEDPLAAGALQSIPLQVEGLFGCRDPGIADLHILLFLSI